MACNLRSLAGVTTLSVHGKVLAVQTSQRIKVASGWSLGWTGHAMAGCNGPDVCNEGQYLLDCGKGKTRGLESVQS